MNQNLINVIKMESTQKLVAFGWSSSNKNIFSIREAIADAKKDLTLQSECIEVFGADFNTVVQALEKHADLDKQYFPELLF